MELKERMDLLLSAGVLSQKNYENVEKVIAYFKQQHGIELTEENAAAFITHLCMADVEQVLCRIGRGYGR